VTSRPVSTTIRFEPGADPIRGTVATEGTERSFLGWLELLALLEHVVQSIPGQPPIQEDP
jgi:hypothetical protein